LERDGDRVRLITRGGYACRTKEAVSLRPGIGVKKHNNATTKKKY
jgi:hypothetical protein